MVPTLRPLQARSSSLRGLSGSRCFFFARSRFFPLLLLYHSSQTLWKKLSATAYLSCVQLPFPTYRSMSLPSNLSTYKALVPSSSRVVGYIKAQPYREWKSWLSRAVNSALWIVAKDDGRRFHDGTYQVRLRCFWTSGVTPK